MLMAEKRFYTLPDSKNVLRLDKYNDLFRLVDINKTKSWQDTRGQMVGCGHGYLVDGKGRLFVVDWNIESNGEIEIHPPEITGLTFSDLIPCEISTTVINTTDWMGK